MAITLKEHAVPIIMSLGGVVLTSALGYFAFVKSNAEEHVAARKSFETIGTKLTEIEKYNTMNHKRISSNEQAIASLAGLPPRVTTLEQSVNSIQVSIAKQDTKLDYIQSDIREIKDILKGQ
jgi:hypothetical protein